MRIARPLAACLAAAATLGPGAAGAVAFPKADLNHDGVVTYEEAQRVFYGLKRVQFVKCDIDGDGALDKGEFPLLNNFYWLVDER